MVLAFPICSYIQLVMNPEELPLDQGLKFQEISAEAMKPSDELGPPLVIPSKTGAFEPVITDPWDDTPVTTESAPVGIQEASAQVLEDQEQAALIDAIGVATYPEVVIESADPQDMEQRKQSLKAEIIRAEADLAQLRQQTAEAQAAIGQLIQDGLQELERRKKDLQIQVEQLERRQERVRAEMRTTFAGVSQDLAIRVQSFKDYLIGSLQDLALAAEQLEFPKLPESSSPPVLASDTGPEPPLTPKFAKQSFQEQTGHIRDLLDLYRRAPDYYGPPWQLRRTFEPIHAERVSNWFFNQGGRGAVRTMNSRLQNILVASAAISILRDIYDDRLHTLILADSPERLGEWRRGLQDCLGITRSDFGPDRGVTLFEDPYALGQRAERLEKEGLLPLIVIDETEDLMVNLSLLQFPLWLAFAPSPQQTPAYSYY
ncbi:MAG TPA: DUF3086 domain-containing protein [Coleofasciculaceae cyanobacterium]